MSDELVVDRFADGKFFHIANQPFYLFKTGMAVYIKFFLCYHCCAT